MEQELPQIDSWLQELKSHEDAARIGMYLIHNGVVRGTARDGSVVNGMELSYDRQRLSDAVDAALAMPGIVCARAWINEGNLRVGDDIMYALVAGDIRENVIGALQEFVRTIKTEVVVEREVR
jgi:molybdopterin synthase catalytic subunit